MLFGKDRHKYNGARRAISDSKKDDAEKIQRADSGGG